MVTLRARILLVVGASLLPGLAITVATVVAERRARIEEARARTQAMVHDGAREQASLMREAAHVLREAARVPGVLDGNAEVCERELRAVFEGTPESVAPARLTRDLKVDCATETIDPKWIDLSHVASIREAVRTRREVTGFYRLSHDGTMPLATIVQPIFDEQGALRNVLIVDVRLPWFERMVSERETNVSLGIADLDGNILITHNARGTVPGGHIEPEKLRLMRASREATIETRGVDGVDRLYTWTRLPSTAGIGSIFALGIPTQTFYATADDLLRTNVLLLLLGAAVAIGLALLVGSVTLERDVRDLVRASAGASLSGTARIERRSRVAEIDQLARAFDAMLVKLRDEQRHSAALADASPDRIVRCDASLIILDANAQIEKLTGMSREQMRGMSIAELAINTNIDSSIVDAARRAVVEKKPLEVEISAGAAPATRWFELRAVPALDEHGEVTDLLLINRDITPRKRLELQLARAQRMESVGQLAGGIAHDFNNMLTVVMANAGFAKQSLPAGHPATFDIDEVLDAAKRSSALTRQLLAFARRQPTTPQDIGIAQFLADAAALLRRLLGSHIELRLGADESLPAVRFDPTHFEQVIVNLAVNARDAMPNGGWLAFDASVVAIEGDDATGAPAPGRYVRLDVTDTGTGMAPEIVSRVFEPFFSTKAPGDGTGLGLAVTYGAVTQNGGAITVDSEPGVGTTFHLFLPVAHEARITRVTPARPSAVASGTGQLVLVVDDDDRVRSLTGRILRAGGYEVLEANDGHLALHELAELGPRKVDLVLTDMVMPNLGGEELVARVRAFDPSVAVLVASGYSDDARRQRVLSYSRTMYIAKPFAAEELLRAVATLLETSTAHSEV